MSIAVENSNAGRPMHSWLRKINAAFVPGPVLPILEEVAGNTAEYFRRLGNGFQSTPDRNTDVILTTACFGKPVDWRKCIGVTARRRFNLRRTPEVWTLLHLSEIEFRGLLGHLRSALAKESPAPGDYNFPGLAPRAFRSLYEQGCRGGPILALQRIIQVQVKSYHVLLVIGDERPAAAYHFDLVGAYPRSDATDPDTFYSDIVMRIVTTLSANEVKDHQVTGESIPYDLWQRLATPDAMAEAGRQLGRRGFFTDMVRVTDLVDVPALDGLYANQYSEGCYGTWDRKLKALVATVTGSARPVNKGSITEDDLAIIVGVRPDGKGALVRQVEGKRNYPASSEAVEMIDMDSVLPTTALDFSDGTSAYVPVVRSKLHGHRGVCSYDPHRVEYVPLDPPYYYYLVSCATDAQAQGIKAAFARSEALRNPADTRQVAFTVLPGHGVVMVEKWVRGKAPFQIFWEYMDAGYLEIDSHVPQGPMMYAPDSSGRMVLQCPDSDDILCETT
jgi:hypothetical protein